MCVAVIFAVRLAWIPVPENLESSPLVSVAGWVGWAGGEGMGAPELELVLREMRGSHLAPNHCLLSLLVFS